MADIQHNSLDSTNLHVPGYTQASDPGAIGAGKLWIDTSGGTGNWVTKVRNAANTDWEPAGGGLASSGYSGYSGYSGGGGGGSNTYTVGITDADLVSGIATITHSLNSRTPLVGVYDNNYNLVLPDEIQTTDVNTLTVDLSSFGTITGTWNVRVTV